MKIFGILAYPVHHSLSPQMHNAGIVAENVDAMYTRFGVEPRMLENFLAHNMGKTLETQKISGLSVSVPHKETCQNFLDFQTKSARRIGAVNTIYWGENKNGEDILCGTNTDCEGFGKALDEKYDISGKNILVLGAGGATKAILFALLNTHTKNPEKIPHSISLWNRTEEKAQKLAEDFGEDFIEVISGDSKKLSEISGNFDLVINTTSLGMLGEWEDYSPVGKDFWKKSHTAFDIVYTPLETRFLRECREAGGAGISGEKMLLFQGIAQFEIFTGKKVSEKTQKIMSDALVYTSEISQKLENKNWKKPEISEEEKQNILGTIVKHKETEIFSALEFLEQKLSKGEFLFSKKLRENKKNNVPHLIAEIKPASPSKGQIFREDDTVEKIAKMYEENGVSCISVLTDHKFFGASAENLKKARKIVDIPLLRKDFIIHPAQIFEARYLGADAVLLMKSVLSTEEIQKFLDICKRLGMDALVEVHDEAEFSEVIENTSAEIIGVNTRDLKTLTITPENFQNILDFGYKKFPEKMRNKIFVAESGISSAEDVQKYAKNSHAILVGTGILLSENREEKIRELV